jgi:hypothetical protein
MVEATDEVKTRYDEAVAWLKDVAAKKANILHEAMISGTASNIDMSLNPDDMDLESSEARLDDESDLAKQKQKHKKAYKKQII